MKTKLILMSTLLILSISGCNSSDSVPEVNGATNGGAPVQASAVGLSSSSDAAPSGGATLSERSPAADPVVVANVGDVKEDAGEDPMPVDAPAVKAARHAYATFKGVSDDMVMVVKVESVQWPNSAMGCPVPGTSYLEVITPGYRVILSVGTDQAEYHTNATDNPQVIACESAAPPGGDDSTR